jgi:hypothetical protein
MLDAFGKGASMDIQDAKDAVYKVRLSLCVCVCVFVLERLCFALKRRECSVYVGGRAIEHLMFTF